MISAHAKPSKRSWQRPACASHGCCNRLFRRTEPNDCAAGRVLVLDSRDVGLDGEQVANGDERAAVEPTHKFDPLSRGSASMQVPCAALRADNISDRAI